MTLITLVLAGGFTALIQGSKMIEDARDVTRVSQVIQSEVESLRTMTWDDLVAMMNPNTGSRSYPYYRQLPLQGKFAEKYGDKYNLWRGVYFEDWNNDGVGDQIGVYVWVGWTPQNGNWKWQRYYTRFTKDGLNDYYYRAF